MIGYPHDTFFKSEGEEDFSYAWREGDDSVRMRWDRNPFPHFVYEDAIRRQAGPDEEQMEDENR